MVAVAVEFVGGPCEGEVRVFEETPLAIRLLVFQPTPRYLLDPLREVVMVGPIAIRSHEYVLHRFGDRLEYVHDGRREG